MSHRPADNIVNLRACWMPVQIGVSYKDTGCTNFNMMHHCKCHMCGIAGTPLDIMRHERFDHGHYFPIGTLGEEHNGGTAPAGLTDLHALQLPHEATQLLAQANSTYATETNEIVVGLGLGPFVVGGFGLRDTVCFFDVRVQGNNCKAAVDVYRSQPDGAPQSIGNGTLVVLIQQAPNTAPVVLLSIGILMSSRETSEASPETFDAMKVALGLNDTSPAQLLVTLMSRAMTLDYFKTAVLGRNFRRPADFHSVPILYLAYQMWLAAEGQVMETVESSDDESEGSFDY